MSKTTIATKDPEAPQRFNSLAHGLRSAYTVLPWENAEDYRLLVQGLMEHHNPQGPTEAHLVEEIANVIWRKQRVLLAEGALYRKELAEDVRSNYRSDDLVNAAVIGKAPTHLQMGKVSLALTVGPEEERQGLAYATQALGRVVKLRNKVARAENYEQGFFMLPEDIRQAYEERIGEEMTGYCPKGGDPDLVYEYGTELEDLLHFLDAELIPNLEGQTMQHRYAEDIANQVKGQAFNPEKLEVIGRYETHLDRKLERMLGMLLKTQELRQRGGSV